MENVALLEARNIEKRFGAVLALDKANFSGEAGEVHALLGANGAGKSTIVKILSGVLSPDRGTFKLEGHEKHFRHPIEAQNAGVATVFQELSVFPHLTVSQNVVIGREPRGLLHQIDMRRVKRTTKETLAKLGAEHILPDSYVKDLSLADRQLIEIARAVAHESKVLILDEPTSALNAEEVQRLFDQIRTLRDRGVLIVFISHKLDEIRRIADRVTIFRDGKDVGTLTGSFDSNAIVSLTLGKELETLRSGPKSVTSKAEKVLTVQDLTVDAKISGVSFDIHAGEILGLAGLEGQGQSDLMLALFGVYRGVHGKIFVSGKPRHLKNPWRAIRAGMALIPEDRKTQGLFPSLPILNNVSIAYLFSKVFATALGFIAAKRERARVASLMTETGIKASGVDHIVSGLSGGNQQKVVLAKWLVTDAKVFLLFDPTRGIDIGAKVQFYEAIRRLADRDRGILLYSTEVDELVMLCDRVMVMDSGRIVSVLEKDELSTGTIAKKWLGHEGAAL